MIEAIVLAAGEARRMGRPKLLLEIDGRSIVRRVVENALASGVDEVVVVVGAAAEGVRARLAGLPEGRTPLRLVQNERFALGQSASLQAGLAALDERAEASLILLGDQPLVTAEIVDALIARYRVGDVKIVYALYEGRRGTPVLFDRALFPELMAVTGDQGGRDVIGRHSAKAAGVPGAAEAGVDVDTWEDYGRLVGRLATERNEG